MDWRSWGKYAKVLSDAPISHAHAFKGYSISKVFIGEKVIYELWALPKQENLGLFNSFNDAKNFICDYEKKQLL